MSDWLDEVRERLSAASARNQLVASVWWCGDEICDCSQAQIEERRPGERIEGGYRGELIDTRWKGRFYSGGSEAARAELDAVRLAFKWSNFQLYERIIWVGLEDEEMAETPDELEKDEPSAPPGPPPSMEELEAMSVDEIQGHIRGRR